MSGVYAAMRWAATSLDAHTPGLTELRSASWVLGCPHVCHRDQHRVDGSASVLNCAGLGTLIWLGSQVAVILGVF